jgi:membrane carboxypeptidase/penicillin-binding protein PbpC
MHERVAIDPRNELRAGPACPASERRLFERYPAPFAAWATEAGRPLAPADFSPLCPGVPAAAGEVPRISYPTDGARFHLDGGSRQQEIVFLAQAPEGHAVRFLLNGRSVGETRAPFRVAWTLERGTHRLEALVGNHRSEAVRFEVE